MEHESSRGRIAELGPAWITAIGGLVTAIIAGVAFFAASVADGTGNAKPPATAEPGQPSSSVSSTPALTQTPPRTTNNAGESLLDKDRKESWGVPYKIGSQIVNTKPYPHTMYVDGLPTGN